jgi:hypothetical protein
MFLLWCIGYWGLGVRYRVLVLVAEYWVLLLGLGYSVMITWFLINQGCGPDLQIITPLPIPLKQKKTNSLNQYPVPNT